MLECAVSNSMLPTSPGMLSVVLSVLATLDAEDVSLGDVDCQDVSWVGCITGVVGGSGVASGTATGSTMAASTNATEQWCWRSSVSNIDMPLHWES
jgi:hypothetical protein